MKENPDIRKHGGHLMTSHQIIDLTIVRGVRVEDSRLWVCLEDEGWHFLGYSGNSAVVFKKLQNALLSDKNYHWQEDWIVPCHGRCDS